MGRPRKYPEGYKQFLKNERLKDSQSKKEKYVPGLGMTRFGYLKKFPSRIKEDQDNQAARLRGYDDDGIRQLLAAVSLQAVMDYKRALGGKGLYGGSATDLKQECDAFFRDEFFQYFVNGMKLEEIHKWIEEMPKDNYHGGVVVRKEDDYYETDPYDDFEEVFYDRPTTKREAKGRCMATGNHARFAKITRPILEKA